MAAFGPLAILGSITASEKSRAALRHVHLGASRDDLLFQRPVVPLFHLFFDVGFQIGVHRQQKVWSCAVHVCYGAQVLGRVNQDQSAGLRKTMSVCLGIVDRHQWIVYQWLWL